MKAKTLYTPIIKGKENDVMAFGRVPSSLAVHVHPLVELLPPDDGETIEAACVRFAHQLRTHCPLFPVSVDLHAIAPKDVICDGSLALEALCANLRAQHVAFTPVFGFDHEPELWDRVIRIAVREDRGLTIRLKIDDLEQSEDTISEIVERLRYAGISSNTTKILLDLGSLAGIDTVGLVRLRGMTQEFVELASTAADFALVSVVASSMPKDVGGVPERGERTYYRQEVPLWLNVAVGAQATNIAFGDYGIVHPNFSDKIIATNANAKIRYTNGLHHHIFRGYSIKEGLKFHQFHELASRVVESTVYLDRDYSFGDNYTWQCANRMVSSGNLGTWVEVDMNHHLVYTANQLPQLFSQIAAGVSADELLEFSA